MYKKHYLIFFLSSLSNIYCMNWDNLWVIAANTLAHALGDPRNNTSNHSPRKPSFSAMTASENTIQSCQIIMPDPFMTQKNCSIQWGFFVPDSESHL